MTDEQKQELKVELEQKRELQLSDFFIILIPTRSNKMDINTMFMLSAIADGLGKMPLVSTDDSPMIDRTRTRVLRKLRDKLDAVGIKYGKTVRALWMDDDISLYDSIEHIVEVIKTADQRGINLLANYHNVWTGGTTMNTIGVPDANGDIRFSTNLQLAKYKDYDPLPEGTVGGMGWVYGDVPVDYVFHFGNVGQPDKEDKGEDVNYFTDNNIPLCFVDLNLKHEKHVRI